MVVTLISDKTLLIVCMAVFIVLTSTLDRVLGTDVLIVDFVERDDI